MAPQSLAHLLLRDVVSDSLNTVNGAVDTAKDARHTVSSWDACMSESYWYVVKPLLGTPLTSVVNTPSSSA